MIGWLVEYYNDRDPDDSGLTGGAVICNSELEAESERAMLHDAGWSTYPPKEIEYDDAP